MKARAGRWADRLRSGVDAHARPGRPRVVDGRWHGRALPDGYPARSRARRVESGGARGWTHTGNDLLRPGASVRGAARSSPGPGVGRGAAHGAGPGRRDPDRRWPDLRQYPRDLSRPDTRAPGRRAGHRAGLEAGGPPGGGAGADTRSLPAPPRRPGSRVRGDRDPLRERLHPPRVVCSPTRGQRRSQRRLRPRSTVLPLPGSANGRALARSGVRHAHRGPQRSRVQRWRPHHLHGERAARRGGHDPVAPRARGPGPQAGGVRHVQRGRQRDLRRRNGSRDRCVGPRRPLQRPVDDLPRGPWRTAGSRRFSPGPCPGPSSAVRVSTCGTCGPST